MAFVLDASVTLAWLFEEDSSREPDASGAFRAIGEERAVVPSIWAPEVANGLKEGERLGRATRAEIARFIEQLGALGVEQDDVTAAHTFGILLDLAREYDLTVYDAAYLELAMRERLPLATLDRALATAARQARVELLGA